MPAPDWLETRTQPIGAGDLVDYLREALDLPETGGREIELGGPQVVTHLELVEEMAAALGRRAPRMVPASSEIARPETVAAGVATVTPGMPEVAAEISLGLTTPSVVATEAVRSCSQCARSGSTRYSRRPWTRTSPRRRSGEQIRLRDDLARRLAQRVWETVMDPSQLERWVTTHDSVAGGASGPLREGDAFTQRMRLAGKSFDVDWRVVETDEPHLALGGRGAGGSRARVRYRLEAEDGGTRFDYRNEFALPGGGLGKLAGGLLAAAPGSARRADRSSACARCSRTNERSD